MRLLDKSNVVLDLESLGFEEWQLKVMDALITRSHGIVLVTGPTGSGKTTTLYAGLAKINSPDLNILTIEDPVEIPLEGHRPGPGEPQDRAHLRERRCAPSCARTPTSSWWARSATWRPPRSPSRPRSPATWCSPPSTPTTPPAPSPASSTWGSQPFLVASSLVGVLAQRLVRGALPRAARRPTAHPRGEAAGRHHRRDPEEAGNPEHLYRAQGCPACQGPGYQGRTGIYELMLVDDDVRPLILRSVDATAIKRAAVDRGMVTLLEHGAYKVAKGITTAAEVLSVTAEDIRLSRNARLRVQGAQRRREAGRGPEGGRFAPHPAQRRCARRASSSPRCWGRRSRSRRPPAT